MTHIVVYEIASPKTNNQFRANWWNTCTETATLHEAVKVFENLKDAHPEYSQIAVYKINGGQTFHNRPRYHCDRRNKVGWVIIGLEGLVNSRSSGMI